MSRHNIPTLFLALALLTTTGACTHQEQTVDGIMDSATMTSFLTDAYIIEGYYNTVTFSDRDSLSMQLQRAYNALYDKYNITPAIYDSSLSYYTLHPKLFEDIYQRVRDNIQDMKNGNKLK